MFCQLTNRRSVFIFAFVSIDLEKSMRRKGNIHVAVSHVLRTLISLHEFFIFFYVFSCLLSLDIRACMQNRITHSLFVAYFHPICVNSYRICCSYNMHVIILPWGAYVSSTSYTISSSSLYGSESWSAQCEKLENVVTSVKLPACMFSCVYIYLNTDEIVMRFLFGANIC